MRLSTFMDSISSFVKKLSETQQLQSKNTFRVAGINSTAEDVKIIIQVIGKSTFMKCTPEEILSNDAFIEQFSKKDIQKIAHSYTQNENIKLKKKTATNLKLVSQEFNIFDRKTNFTLEDSKGNTTRKSAKEITLDKKIIKQLNQEDALNIGYIAGHEHSQDNTFK